MFLYHAWYFIWRKTDLRPEALPAQFIRSSVIHYVSQEIGLDVHRKKQSQALSGGNKRKLNFAISMLNLPEIVFLDEMTTGMDPRARAATWKVLQKAGKMGSSTVITSHRWIVVF